MEIYNHQIGYEGYPQLRMGEMTGEEPYVPVSISPANPLVVDPNAPVLMAGKDRGGVNHPVLTDAFGGLMPSDNVPLPTVVISKISDLYIVDTTGYQSVHFQISSGLVGGITLYWSSDGVQWSNNVPGINNGGSGNQSGISASGQYSTPVFAKYLRMRCTVFTSGSAVMSGHLSVAGLGGTLTNITHMAGVPVPLYGTAPVATIPGMPIATRDWSGIHRQPLSDANGILYTGSSLQVGWKYNTFNVSYDSRTVAINSQTKAQSAPNPTLIGAVDEAGTVKLPLTDPSGNLRVAPTLSGPGYWGMGEGIEELIATNRAMLFYLYQLTAASYPDKMASIEEPGFLVSTYREVINRAQPGEFAEF
jgi:hypothetical protein